MRRLSAIISKVVGLALVASAGSWTSVPAKHQLPAHATAATALLAPPVTVPLPPGVTCPHPIATIAQWPLRRRVAQLLMIGVDARDLKAADRLVVEQHIGGILLRSANGATSAQVIADLADLRRRAGVIPPIVAADEEGGRVQPLRALTGTLPSPRRAAAQLSPAELRERIAEHGAKLAALGITMVLGPVLDVTEQGAGGVIGDRSFGGDPELVAEYGAAYAAGLRDAGLTPVIKHFPGHGGVIGDSHTNRVVAPKLAELVARDIPPFRSVMADGPVAVMMGHMEVPGLTGEVPASVSKRAITSYLRTSLRFHNLVITDSLSMGAITTRWRGPGAAAESLVAGADVALFVTISERDAIGLIDAVEQIVKDGRLPEAQLNRSVFRVLRAKGLSPCGLRVETPGPRISQ